MALTVLVIGATGSVGRQVVAEAIRHGHTVHALVRDPQRARNLPAEAELVVGDLTDPTSLEPAVEEIDAIVFTHGAPYGSAAVKDVDYGGVRNVLQALHGRPARIALMTSIGVTRRIPLLDWKRRGERLVRASGNEYTIVRPGWFDMESEDQRRIVMLQGDTRQSGTPADGVIGRDQIARVLIDALTDPDAAFKTLELVADHGPEQPDLGHTFAQLDADARGSLDGAQDADNMPLTAEPADIVADLDQVREG